MELDVSAKDVLKAMVSAQAQGTPQLHQVSAQQAREMLLRSKETFGTPGPDIAEVRDIEIPSYPPPGVVGEEVSTKIIPARFYRDHADKGPIIIYYHGGGWVIGDLESHDGLCRHLAKESGLALLAVDYRLAPEHPFPAAVDDAYTALEWVAAQGEILGVDISRIALAGDSAGGNLSAVVAQLAKERGGPAIKMQALLYPATDMRGESESHRMFTNHLLTPDSYQWFLKHYLLNPMDRDDPRASPLRSPNLEGLPTAFVLTAGFDPLRDEGKAYADKLKVAGVKVIYRCFEGQIHGFLTLDKMITEAKRAVCELSAALKEELV